MRGCVVEVGYAMPDARLFLWMASVAHDAVRVFGRVFGCIQTHDQTHQLPVGIQKASTVDRYMGVRGPGIAELRSVASRVAS